MNSPHLVCLVSLTLCLAGCLKNIPDEEQDALSIDGGAREAELIGPKVAALEQEIAQVVSAVDEALWQHWTTAAPLDLQKLTADHQSLFSKPSLSLLKRARELRPDETQHLANLEHWLSGELLARAVSAESEALANLEASASFTLDGKDIAWRDLNRILVNEPSAVKRRSLWAASLPTAMRLDAAIAHRDSKVKEALAALELPAALDFAAEARGLDLDALQKTADEVLTSTEAEWKTALETLSQADVKLPISAMTRADLPRLLKMPPGVDNEFPKSRIAPRVLQTMGTLGVYGRSGLTIDLTESAKKKPLPLTVAPAPGDVRSSLKPSGGLLNQEAVLNELGVALTLHALSRDRLGQPSKALRTGELFASLVTEDAWLSANEVKDKAAVIAAAKTQRLYLLRRAAGVVLAKLETQLLNDDAEARSKFVTITSRAMGLTPRPEDGARWRLETDDFLRSATQLEAMRAAEKWRQELGDGWWLRPWP